MIEVRRNKKYKNNAWEWDGDPYFTATGQSANIPDLDSYGGSSELNFSTYLVPIEIAIRYGYNNLSNSELDRSNQLIYERANEAYVNGYQGQQAGLGSVRNLFFQYKNTGYDRFANVTYNFLCNKEKLEVEIRPEAQVTINEWLVEAGPNINDQVRRLEELRDRWNTEGRSAHAHIVQENINRIRP